MSHSYTMAVSQPGVEPRSFEAFKLMMEARFQARKERVAVTQERLSRERVIQKTIWCRQLKLAMRHLGLTSVRNPTNTFLPRSNLNKFQTAMNEDGTHDGTHKKSDAMIQSPTLSENIIFLAIDVSKAKDGQNQVSEIGISTLDTNDLINRPPGTAGISWSKKIRSRNFRIKESTSLVETDFIMIYGDGFKPEFGKSKWISIYDAPKIIASCFGHLSPVPGSRLDDSAMASLNEAAKKIILVGHELKTKIGHLRDIIGFDVTKLRNVLETIDTVDMFRALQQRPKKRTLHSISMELDIPAKCDQYNAVSCSYLKSI